MAAANERNVMISGDGGNMGLIYCICKPNLHWNRQANMPALHPLQIWSCCCTNTGQRETYPCTPGNGAAAPMDLLRFEPPWKGHL